MVVVLDRASLCTSPLSARAQRCADEVREGDPLDPTRAPAFYDATFEYLAGLGIAVLE